MRNHSGVTENNLKLEITPQKFFEKLLGLEISGGYNFQIIYKPRYWKRLSREKRKKLRMSAFGEKMSALGTVDISKLEVILKIICDRLQK